MSGLKKEHVRPETPKDLLTCSSHVSRHLVRQFMEMGALSQADAVAMYVASGVVEMARRGLPFFESEARIAKELGILSGGVRVATMRLKRQGMLTRTGENGDQIRGRRWWLPRLGECPGDTVTNCRPSPLHDETPSVTACNAATVTACNGDLKNSGSEGIKGNKQGEERVGLRPPEPSPDSFHSIPEKRPREPSRPKATIAENGRASPDQVVAALGGRNLADPKGLVAAFFDILAAEGRPGRPVRLDYKRAADVLKSVPDLHRRDHRLQDFLAREAQRGLPRFMSDLTDLWANYEADVLPGALAAEALEAERAAAARREEERLAEEAEAEAMAAEVAAAAPWAGEAVALLDAAAPAARARAVRVLREAIDGGPPGWAPSLLDAARSCASPEGIAAALEEAIHKANKRAAAEAKEARAAKEAKQREEADAERAGKLAAFREVEERRRLARAEAEAKRVAEDEACRARIMAEIAELKAAGRLSGGPAESLPFGDE